MELSDRVSLMGKQRAEHSESIFLEVKVLVDLYWTAWKTLNEDQYRLPEQVRQIGRYAPMVYVHKVNEKIYIDWKDWSPRGRGPRKPGTIHGERVKPLNGLSYKDSQFSKAQPWEFAMIVELEIKFKRYRELIEILHAQKVGLGKFERKHLWQQTVMPE